MAFPDSTSRLDIGRVIEQRLAAQWVSGAEYRTAIQWPSVLGLIDVDKTTVIANPPTLTDWIQLDVIDGDTEAATFGGTKGLNVTTSIIQITINTPRNSGDKQLLTLGGLAKEIFNRYHANGLRCEASSLRKIEAQGGYLRAAIRTPFEYYEEVS